MISLETHTHIQLAPPADFNDKLFHKNFFLCSAAVVDVFSICGQTWNKSYLLHSLDPSVRFYGMWHIFYHTPMNRISFLCWVWLEAMHGIHLKFFLWLEVLVLAWILCFTPLTQLGSKKYGRTWNLLGETRITYTWTLTVSGLLITSSLIFIKSLRSNFAHVIPAKASSPVLESSIVLPPNFHYSMAVIDDGEHFDGFIFSWHKTLFPLPHGRYPWFREWR